MAMVLLKTLGGLRLQDASGAPFTYRGVRGLLLVCYMVDQARKEKNQQKREALAALLWPDTKDPKNNLSRALTNLRNAMAGEDILRTCEDGEFSDPSLELILERVSLHKLDYHALVTVDFAVCEEACAKADVVTVAEVYSGVFLAGIEKRATNLSRGFYKWLKDKRLSLASKVLEACLEVLQDGSAPQVQRHAAQGLLARLSEHDTEVFSAPSLLADAYAYLPAEQQAGLAARLWAMFEAAPATETEPDISVYGDVFMALALQHEPDFDVACQVCQPPLTEKQKVEFLQFLQDSDWLVEVFDNAEMSNPSTRDVKRSIALRERLRGRMFWQRQAIAKAQHIALLERLWQETPERPETLEGLFYLAWHYHQGVTPAVTPQIASPQWRLAEDATLEQLIKANFHTAGDDQVSHQASHQVSQSTRGMGDFADFDWGKLTRVFLYQVQQASRMERFSEVLAITTVWERARGRRKEAQDAQVVWFTAYALERQGDYGKAMEQLTAYAETSDRHQALWASLLFRVGETTVATEMARQLVKCADAWAQAEAHGLLAKNAYFAEDFTRAINHYEHAKLAWIEAEEPCRAIAAEVGVASCYDCRAQADDVQRADDIYNDLAEIIVRQGLPLLTALRTRLNQLMLWDYHDFKTPQEVREGFNSLIETLEQQDVSKEVLGKAWYNFGQHYYSHYQAYAEGVGKAYVDIRHPDLHHARVCYQRALEALEGSRDRVMYACACGELGRIYQLQNNQARADALLCNTVGILSDTKQQSLLAEYQQLLAQGDAGENFSHEPGAV
jgi:hypothetical protein